MMLYEYVDVRLRVDNFAAIAHLVCVVAYRLANAIGDRSKLLHVVLEEIYLRIVLILQLVQLVLVTRVYLVYCLINLIKRLPIVLLRNIRLRLLLSHAKHVNLCFVFDFG
jgi:hypothetical protein